jgi:hypothetical protein
MSFKQLKALWTIGFALMRKLLLLPFVRNPGARPWLERMRQERLTATPAGAWPRLATGGRCIGCGLCELTGAGGTSPYAIIAAAGRRPEDAGLAVGDARALAKAAADIARICPARVGVDDIATLILDNARALGTS